MKTIKSEYFETQEHGVQMTADQFQYQARLKFLAVLNNDNQAIAAMLHDMVMTLKAIVKAELLAEMRKQVDVIDTFYR